MIFGSTNDTRVLLRLRRELLGDILEQEILYYKVNLEFTQDNIYGESTSKAYWTPARMTCLINVGDQSWKDTEFGPDLERQSTFSFIKEDFEDLGFKPEVGDVIEWHKNYFLIDETNEKQFFVGKDENYRIEENKVGKFGESISIICKAHQTRLSSINIIPRQ